MARLLRMAGLLAIAVWAILLVAGEKLDAKELARGTLLPAVGLALLAAGVVLGLLGRAGRALGGGRCARCRRPVRQGELYCGEHFRQSIDNIRDTQRK